MSIYLMKLTNILSFIGSNNSHDENKSISLSLNGELRHSYSRNYDMKMGTSYGPKSLTIIRAKHMSKKPSRLILSNCASNLITLSFGTTKNNYSNFHMRYFAGCVMSHKNAF
ncbi:hypothetical protein V8G54_021572 [Vigna mungo]|uniref:Uncharacterized protein n=1 Tax=Vigna mungo TaxID=3915 RepID=A0AAQ3NFU7_VIGMU